MTSRAADLAAPQRRADRWVLIAAGLLITGFVVAFSARPAIVLSSASVDDGLFMTLGMHLASGRWLGSYNELTLAKGPGFPAFLALSNLLGTPFPLALALLHATCASFAALVSARLWRSAWAGFAMLAALLLTPILYNGEMLGVFRDPFYTALTVALVSAAVALATSCLGRPKRMAALTGVLGAWFWLTREEGVWLVPCLGLLLLIPLFNLGHTAKVGGRGLAARLQRLAPAAIAFAVACALVVGFGLVNWAVYGRFTVNEIKDKTFQGALTALQDASAPFHQEGIPVPAAARARIYAVSPAFASLKEPVLDGPRQADSTQYGCRENPKMCGDFGGGWFFWILRGTAAAQGHHASASEAAVFYTRLTKEVRTACADGRLKCQRWWIPLVPPMRASELPDVAASLGRVLHVMTFGQGVSLEQRPSELEAPNANAMVSFLNLPSYAPPPHRRISGWFVGQGAEWFTVQAPPEVRNLKLERTVSPDLAAHFKDARLGRQRFNLVADCPPREACPLSIALEGGATASMDLATLARGAHPIDRATLYLDDTGDSGASALLKTRLSNAWLHLETKLPLLYRGLLAAGGVAYLLLLARALARRRLTAGLVICTALLASVAARAVILALIDALSFRAASYPYSLPGIALLVMFSVYALQEAAAQLAQSRRARAAEVVEVRAAA
jgi:hypothetical protein